MVTKVMGDFIYHKKISIKKDFVKYTFSGKCTPCNRPNLRQRSTCVLNTILQSDLILDIFVAALCPSSLFPQKGSAYFAILPLHQI